jgi:adenylyl-sulfate kinase
VCYINVDVLDENPFSAWTIWFTGLSGSGKTTLARALARHLDLLSTPHELLDGDELRKELCRDLGFSREDRCENVRRIGYVAGLLNRHNIVSIVAAIAPYRDSRDEIRAKIPNFFEVHIDCAVHTLAQRDVKGLYRRALAGEIKNFTGISDPYESPLNPDLYLNSGVQSEASCFRMLLSELQNRGFLPRDSEEQAGETALAESAIRNG